MRRLRAILPFITSATAPVIVAALLLGPAQAGQPSVSLMETLSPWKYPEAKMLGASMSDGGTSRVRALKCQAIFTTPDPIEKVIRFYSEKVGLASDPARQEAKAEVKDADVRAVSVQDDSPGRPVTIRVIVVNKAETSTTLVISRAEGEKETHIAWSHYLRLDGKH